MSEPLQARADLLDACNDLDEVAHELLFLGVAIAAAWDDNPANGCLYLLNRIRESVIALSDKVRDASEALRPAG